jgi:DNA-binding XRE family transcriptional regulator
MVNNKKQAIECHRMELDGVRYVILHETTYEYLCKKARVKQAEPPMDAASLSPETGIDRKTLAKKLIRRRQVAGLSQTELARRAGVRPETLNRIERGKTTPDFTTIRKLVVAMNATEQEDIPFSKSHSIAKER